MALPPRSPQSAGGVFLAIGALGGALFGVRTGQPTLGLLGGFAAGLALALLIWLLQRRR